MKICRLLLICFFTLFLSTNLFAQIIFPEKVNACNATSYCMDCGTPKANCDPYTLEYISYMVNRKYNFKGGYGSISFQVYVDSLGFSCVLSHNDVTNNQLTWDIIRYLNGCMWKPAIEGGKRVNSSVNVIFTIANNRIDGQMKRMDPKDLAQLKGPDNPTIYNKQYAYTNVSLKTYDFTVWTKFNSLLLDNVGEACVVDKTDELWYATDNGLTRFDGKNFDPIVTPFAATASISSIAVDKDNNKWMNANRAIYMFNTTGWRMYDSTNFKISGTYRIIANPSGEIFFTNSKGLLIVRNNQYKLIDRHFTPLLPSNDVQYAYYDTHQRLWIGTANGSIMIDKKQKVNVFNNPSSPLYNVSISNVTEDENGNLYFSLNSCKKPTGDMDEEGIAVMQADGKWAHYNDKNSGMPSNHVNSILYDKFEHVLWIATQLSGLVRFDLKGGWENYNNANSTIPGYDIRQLTQDSKGVIYAATANGMLIIKKK
jgi:hypothetical protein